MEITFGPDHAGEIEPSWLQGVGNVGVTAGASAPEVLVEDVLARLRKLGAESVQEMAGEDEQVIFAVNSNI